MDFSKRYNREEFQKFLESFLTDGFVRKNSYIPVDDYISSKSRYIKECYLIGEDEKLKIPIYEFKHTSQSDPRISLTKEAFRILRNQFVENALAVFISENSDDYRFSYLTVNYRYEGKVIVETSNPKRYSFLLGPNSKLHTVMTQLSGKVNSLEDLRNRFSIEVVNKEFYKGIHDIFYKFVNNISLPYDDNDENRKNFTIRFLSRIIFLWFLKKKKSIQGKPLIPEEILSSKAIRQNYYHTVLEPLFFEILNTPIRLRKRNFEINTFDLIRFFEEIPFLNGGLFTPKKHDFYELEESGKSKYYDSLRIPDILIKELFEHLETYNFTVDENTPIDIELSIDPEMLGLILENLLAEINPETGESARKELGSFYTPKEIVDFMVTESLKYYLLEHTNISEEKIEKILQSYLDIQNEDDLLTCEEKKEILNAFYNIKILDPACGSGAFPVGMLLKLTHILEFLDPKASYYKEIMFQNLSSSLKIALENRFKTETFQFIRKLHIIEKSIYGVDIQEVAIELAKLRIYLSLIIESKVDDTKENRNIQPLPNLEFKFVAADSLIKLPLQKDQITIVTKEIEKLKILIKEYFSAISIEKKNKLKREFKKIKNGVLNFLFLEGIFGYYIQNWDPFGDEPAEFFDPFWMFGIEGGFDIVIGNPPYIQLQKDRGKLSKKYKTQGYKTFDGAGDIYCLFYERGIELLRDKGVLCYITSNKWMRAKYGEKLREFFEKYNPKLIVDLGPGVFRAATVDTNILIIQKEENKNELKGIELKDRNTEISKYVEENQKEVYTSKNVWFIGDNIDFKIKEKIESMGKPLKDWNVNIYRGVLTGLNEAFIIDANTRDMILNNCRNEEERKRTEGIIKPVLRGRDIEKWRYKWTGKWLIGTFPSLKLNIEEFPALKEYFLKNFDIRKLEQSGKKYPELGFKSRKKTSNKWFETQDSINYYQEFEKEKVVWQRVTKKPMFCIVPFNFYVLDSMVFFTGNDLNYLTGILNSKLIHFYILKNVHKLGSNGFLLSNQFVEKLPISLLHNKKKLHQKKEIDFLVSKIIMCQKNSNLIQKISKIEIELNLIIYDLYELTSKEIEYIERKV
ncbi:Eco57I restriction-modification methylase domain-containing protein [Thermosipho globiformans]|uniref:Eco57I restriction-modification methylase domain-containing protein n=1 Tax=Thermosipho globiformans TaxID=380685 RepID=UPI000F8D2C12|nr:N-6 DNA methylase [Thermosipho globiformans]